MPNYSYIWEYHVAPERRGEFERHYGPDGAWVALFARAPGYLGTVLLKDRVQPLRYVTIDTWADVEAYEAFRQGYRAEYAELDALCAGFTTQETALGEFDGPALPDRTATPEKRS